MLIKNSSTSFIQQDNSINTGVLFSLIVKDLSQICTLLFFISENKLNFLFITKQGQQIIGVPSANDLFKGASLDINHVSGKCQTYSTNSKTNEQ